MTGPVPASLQDGPAAPAVSLEGICKKFNATYALHNVSLQVGRAEVLALLGENGAGKSTLIKILGGIYQPDEGRIVVDGALSSFRSPHDATRAGIVVIPQELRIVRGRSVGENICLGNLPARRAFGLLPRTDEARMFETAAAALARLGSNLDPRQRAGQLTFAEQQTVIIARALTHDPRVLILDEPTASLGEKDTERLFEVLLALKRNGVAMIYITHRLPEVRRISERACILRDGKVAGSFAHGEFDEVAITAAITGRTGNNVAARQSSRRKDSNFTTRIGSFELGASKGEVVGVTGLMGSGAAQIVRNMFGLGSSEQLIQRQSSSLPVTKPAQAISSGFGFVPGERTLAAFPNLTVRENIMLPNLGAYSSPFRLRNREIEALLARLLKLLDVRPPNPNARMGSLSGGNQQKVLFGRCLVRALDVLLLDEPTAGIDVAAKARIHRLIADFAAEGGSVVVASTDMTELCDLCDRILAVRKGIVVADIAADQGFDEAAIRSAIGSTS
jgi:ribose transport system ATP-binding protein